MNCGSGLSCTECLANFLLLISEWCVYLYLTDVPLLIYFQYMASYHTSCQPKAGQLGKKAKKTAKPKKVKSKYSGLDIVKVLFEDRVGDETQRGGGFYDRDQATV